MKDESANETESATLTAKTYSYLMDDDDDKNKKANNTKKCAIKQKINFKMWIVYEETIKNL